MAGVFTLVLLSSIGLPGLNGFVGEFLILIGAFSAAPWWTVVAVTGVILAALYLLWAYQRTFHGPAEGENATMEDLRLSELAGIAPLLILIVFLGIYPKPVLERIEPAVDVLITHIEERVSVFDEDEPVPTDRGGAPALVTRAEEIHAELEAKEAAEEAEAEEEATDESEEADQ